MVKSGNGNAMDFRKLARCEGYLDEDGVCDTEIDQISSEGFYIPDGSGVSYQSSINVTEFDINSVVDSNNLDQFDF